MVRSIKVLMVRTRYCAVSNHEDNIGASSFETRFALLRLRSIDALMVRRRSCAVSNHEAANIRGLILRDALCAPQDEE
jgi:hypothetical protein